MTPTHGGPAPAPVPLEPPPARGPVRSRAGLVLGLLVFLVLAFVPSPLHRVVSEGASLGHRPAFAAAVAALMAVWWFTEAIPMAWTACVPLVAYPLLGVFAGGFAGNVEGAFLPFADAYIFLFMGGMAIGGAMEHWGLHRRTALHIMSAVGTEPRRLLAGMLLATAAVSLWISNTATAVMMMPIAMALLSQLEAGHRRPGFAAAIMLSVAYGANIGGIGTKIGTGTNSIFAGFVERELGVEIGFLLYLALGVPFVVLLLPMAWALLWRLGRRDAPAGQTARELLEREIAALGPMAPDERKVAVVFAAAALLWIGGDLVRPVLAPHVPTLWEGFRFQGKHYEAGVAMCAALALFLLRALPRAALARVPWSTLLLLGGSFSLAAGIDGSGLSLWMAQGLAPLAALPLLAQLAIASFATVGLSALASNTATVSVMLNVLPRSLPVLSATAIAASCDFMLPAGTPPNAIVFGSGRIRLPVMMRTGFVLDVLAAALAALYAYVYLARLL